MTEESFQLGRKVMQSANYLRGRITAAKGKVAYWTHMEDGYRRNLKEAQANGAKKQIEKALDQLAAARKKFADLKFPDSDIPNPPEKKKKYHPYDEFE